MEVKLERGDTSHLKDSLCNKWYWTHNMNVLGLYSEKMS